MRNKNLFWLGLILLGLGIWGAWAYNCLYVQLYIFAALRWLLEAGSRHIEVTSTLVLLAALWPIIHAMAKGR